MRIRLTKHIKDEDGHCRTDLDRIHQVFLWKDHPNYQPGCHTRSGQQHLLVIGYFTYNSSEFGGWFLSASRFRKFVLDGTIIILTQGDSI